VIGFEGIEPASMLMRMISFSPVSLILGWCVSMK